MDKPNKLLLVGQFRHYFIGLGLALHDKDHNYHLIFINQSFDDERNPILQASLKLMKPFASVSCLPLRTSAFRQKNSNRKAAFKQLREKILEISPVEIATGNDRRIEFQYSMHFARNVLKLDVKGAYLDNGTGSYISFQKLNMGKYLARKWIDVPIKKLVYGNWFTRMQRFGGSDWTEICYLTHPSLAPARLLKRQCVGVEVDYYKTEQGQHIIKSIVNSLGGENVDGVEGAKILLVLPRGTVIEEIYGSLNQAEIIVKRIAADYGQVYVKYHPGDQKDILNFSEVAIILPSPVPIEILFSVMNFDKVIGDTSTAILSAKWMLPNAEVSFFDMSTAHTDCVRKLFSDMNITPLEINLVDAGVP